MDAAQIAENERRETACLNGITAVRLYSQDGAAPADLVDTLTDAQELLEGLILYAQLLEATMSVANNTDPVKVRRAAEASAAMWRTRITAHERQPDR